MPPEAELIRPVARLKRSFIEAVAEIQQVDQRGPEYDVPWLEAHFDEFVRALLRRETQPPPGRVTESVFWLVQGDDYIGRTSVRHTLNDSLRQFGGHIGYEIRPSRRQQGYGMHICRLALEEARRLGLRRVLITCDEHNTASRRIIEANGGQFTQALKLPYHPAVVLHFWVTLETELLERGSDHGMDPL